jgi:hypothetical protein
VGATVDYTQRAASGLLYYRRAVPADLKPFVQGSRGQVRRSLGGTSITAPGAMERYQAAAAEYDRLLAVARRAKAGTADPLDQSTIAYLAGVFQRDMQESAQASYNNGNAEPLRRGWD